MWKKIKDWFKPPEIGFIEARRDGVSCPLYQDVNLTEPTYLVTPQEEIYIDLDNEPDEFVVTMTDGQVFTFVKDWVIKNSFIVHI